MNSPTKSLTVILFAAFAIGSMLVVLNVFVPLGATSALTYISILLLALWSPRRSVVLILCTFVVALITLDAWLCPLCQSFAEAMSIRLPSFVLALILNLMLLASPRPYLAQAQEDWPQDDWLPDDWLAGNWRQSISERDFYESSNPLTAIPVPAIPQPGLTPNRYRDDADELERQKHQMAALAHEVRSPLNAMVGFAEIIETELYGPLGNDRYKDYARNIQTSGQHILSVTEDYLGLARQTSGQATLSPSRIHIRQMIERVVDMIGPLALNADVDIKVDAPWSLPDLRADSSKLDQILINLLVNAIKFTDHGGRITIAAATASDGPMILTVADTGVGMTPAEAKAVLEPFARADTPGRPREGAGLGLSLVKSMVEMHDGEFWLESDLNIGTTAFIRLPARRVLTPLDDAKASDQLTPTRPPGAGSDAQAELFSSTSM